jgi:SAM-dependent MidA family methyltransferase
MTLAELLHEHIGATGPVTFRWFMQQALYHPEHGYYAAGKAAIGRRGDYFTNVSVGPVFGQLLALQFNEIRARLNAGDFTIVEQGAHDGQFACDVLDALTEKASAFRYIIIEPFEPLAALQRETLRMHPNVQWRRSLEELEPFAGVHFSNEFVDAMPVHLVTCAGGKWRELHIKASSSGFEWVLRELSCSALVRAVHKLPQIDGLQIEINLESQMWLRQLASKIQRGIVMTIDYGYLREDLAEKRSGTLTCYSRHRRSTDMFARIGDSDITAHVDWTSTVEHAEDSGFDLLGFTDQHHFMVGLGEQFLASSPSDEMIRQYKMLMHPELMGVTFQVLALSKDFESDAPLRGFSFAHARRAVEVNGPYR